MTSVCLAADEANRLILDNGQLGTFSRRIKGFEGYHQSHTINNGSTTTATISDLPVGTYYLVITTQDTGSRNSGYSTSVTKQTQ